MHTQHRVFLSDGDRAKLSAIISSGSALFPLDPRSSLGAVENTARYQTKARILLLTDRNRADRMTDDQIIAFLGTSNSNIQRTRMSFLAVGLEGCLKDKPRSGRKPRITGDVQAKLTVLACSTPPDGRCKWTLELLSKHMVLNGYIDTISKDAVCKHLKKTGLSLG